MSLDALVERAVDSLKQVVGVAPRWVAAAPGRVNLIGEHVDYNDGFVLPLAIDRHVVIAASSRDDRLACWHSLSFNEAFTIEVDKPIERGEPAWSNYVRGVMAGFAERGVALPGFDAVIVSDVPLGGGLSSSAALEVAAATLFEAIADVQLDPIAKALLCQQAEHEFAGMPCGIMDQFASTLAKAGQLLLIDCRSQAVEFIPLRDEGLVVMVIDTGVKHALTDGGYAARRAQCYAAAEKLGVRSLRDATMSSLEVHRAALSDVEWRRARHVITEIARTQEAVIAVRQEDWQALGRLMAASHVSLRDDYEVSCVELDWVVAAADAFSEEKPGTVVGTRMTGGGFGGCAISLIQKSVAGFLAARIVGEYRSRFGFEPAVFVSSPVGGARCLQ